MSAVPEETTPCLALAHVFEHLRSELTPAILCDLVAKLHAIRVEFTGDGAGLSGGTVSDKFIVAYLAQQIKDFKEFHSQESDCKIKEHPMSVKKINGCSTVALNWSKNGEDSKKRELFETDILIVNLKTEQWWKKAPKIATVEERASNYFSTPIPAGIYLISRDFCKKNVCVKSNNKTDTLIDQVPLYKMLRSSIDDGRFITFPTEYPTITFDILKAFTPVHA